jgi:hypothetical protein
LYVVHAAFAEALAVPTLVDAVRVRLDDGQVVGRYLTWYVYLDDQPGEVHSDKIISASAWEDVVVITTEDATGCQQMHIFNTVMVTDEGVDPEDDLCFIGEYTNGADWRSWQYISVAQMTKMPSVMTTLEAAA